MVDELPNEIYEWIRYYEYKINMKHLLESVLKNTDIVKYIITIKLNYRFDHNKLFVVYKCDEKTYIYEWNFPEKNIDVEHTIKSTHIKPYNRLDMHRIKHTESKRSHNKHKFGKHIR